MDFDESLPSHSAFIAPVRSTQQRQFMPAVEETQKGTICDSDGEVSPPPPPPPIQNDAAGTAAAIAHTSEKSASSTNSGGRKGPFPFLKKKSRKEATALARIEKESATPPKSRDIRGAEPRNHEESRHEPIAAAGKENRSTSDGAYPRRGNDNMLMEDNGEEIVLQDKVYWDQKHRQPPQPPHQHHHPGDGRGDGEEGANNHLDHSTISIAGAHWRAQRDNVQQELEEFESIEKQLESATNITNKEIVASNSSTTTNTAAGTTTTDPTTLSSDSYRGDYNFINHGTGNQNGWTRAEYNLDNTTTSSNGIVSIDGSSSMHNDKFGETHDYTAGSSSIIRNNSNNINNNNNNTNSSSSSSSSSNNNTNNYKDRNSNTMSHSTGMNSEFDDDENVHNTAVARGGLTTASNATLGLKEVEGEEDDEDYCGKQQPLSAKGYLDIFHQHGSHWNPPTADNNSKINSSYRHSSCHRDDNDTIGDRVASIDSSNFAHAGEASPRINDTQHTQEPSRSESPSWGRVTRPFNAANAAAGAAPSTTGRQATSGMFDASMGHSPSEVGTSGAGEFDVTPDSDDRKQDDEEGHQDDMESGWYGSRYDVTNSNQIAPTRMSQSALRKISSRSAALQQQQLQQQQQQQQQQQEEEEASGGSYGVAAATASAGGRIGGDDMIVHTRPLSQQQQQQQQQNRSRSQVAGTSPAPTPRSGSRFAAAARGKRSTSNSSSNSNALSSSSAAAGGRTTETVHSWNGSGGMGVSAGRGSTGNSGADMAGGYLDASLVQKARELETELATYKSENAHLKKLRRQQESALAEVVQKREEVMKWATEEKSRTLKWCEEQQQFATKERRTAAKLARDSRQRAAMASSGGATAGMTGGVGTLPIRKEKAEIEALRATVEKMKLEHETATKKWKLNEQRLYKLIKDHAAHIDENEKQVLALEQDKLALLEFIGEQGIRLPKALRSLLQRNTTTTNTTTSTKTSTVIPQQQQQQISKLNHSVGRGSGSGSSSTGSHTSSAVARNVLRGKPPYAGGRRSGAGACGDTGYVEEVDVEYVESSSSSSMQPMSHHSVATAAINTVAPGDAYQPGTLFNHLADPIRSSHSNGGQRRSGSGGGGGGGGSDTFSSTHAPPLRASTATGTSTGSAGGVVDGNMMMVGDSNDITVSSSWARSTGSRSSGRYSNSRGEEEEEEEEDINDDAEEGENGSSTSHGNRNEANGCSPVVTSKGEDTFASMLKAERLRRQNSETSATTADTAVLDVMTVGVVGGSSAAAADVTLRHEAHGHAHTSEQQTRQQQSNRVEDVLPSGKKVIRYRNGTRKEVDVDGSTKVFFLNGDTKRTEATSGLVVYYYAAADTTHSTFTDGLEVYEFPNQQVEMHNPNGVKEILFPDGTRKIISPDGMQESHFPDGVILREHADGRREVLSST